MNKKPLLVTLKTLNKIKMDFYNDPFQEIRKNFVYNPDIKIQLMGTQITSKEQITEATKKYQIYIRKSNNPIEIDKVLIYPK